MRTENNNLQKRIFRLTNGINKINRKNMKGLVKIFSLSVCVVLLSTNCKKRRCECEKEMENDYYCYTDYVGNLANSQVQVGDTVYYFDAMEGYYCYTPRFDKNTFGFFMNSFNYLQNPIRVSILTEKMAPEIFFQKGILEIDTLYIHNDPLIVGGAMHSEYYAVHAIFTWDTVFYENRIFKGNGSIEIMDTLYTNYQDTFYCPNTYYPPQKIEFEFK